MCVCVYTYMCVCVWMCNKCILATYIVCNYNNNCNNYSKVQTFKASNVKNINSIKENKLRNNFIWCQSNSDKLEYDDYESSIEMSSASILLNMNTISVGSEEKCITWLAKNDEYMPSLNTSMDTSDMLSILDNNVVCSGESSMSRDDVCDDSCSDITVRSYIENINYNITSASNQVPNLIKNKTNLKDVVKISNTQRLSTTDTRCKSSSKKIAEVHSTKGLVYDRFIADLSCIRDRQNKVKDSRDNMNCQNYKKTNYQKDRNFVDNKPILYRKNIYSKDNKYKVRDSYRKSKESHYKIATNSNNDRINEKHERGSKSTNRENKNEIIHHSKQTKKESNVPKNNSKESNHVYTNENKNITLKNNRYIGNENSSIKLNENSTHFLETGKVHANEDNLHIIRHLNNQKYSSKSIVCVSSSKVKYDHVTSDSRDDTNYAIRCLNNVDNTRVSFCISDSIPYTTCEPICKKWLETPAMKTTRLNEEDLLRRYEHVDIVNIITRLNELVFIKYT